MPSIEWWHSGHAMIPIAARAHIYWARGLKRFKNDEKTGTIDAVQAHRLIPALLITMLLIFHAQIWYGRGSVSHVNQLQTKLQDLSTLNNATQTTNDQLASEVRDLKEGIEMIEDKARSELGMVKPNEILVQYAK
jgi:cell division protein FtsB